MDQRTEELELLRRCLSHEREAWRDLVARYSRLIYSVVHSTLKRHEHDSSDELVEDLFHQAFLALYDRNYRKLRQWSGRCSLASWVRLVTSSSVVDHLRRIRPTVQLDEQADGFTLPAALIDDSRAAEARLERLEQAAGVRQALAVLSDPDRELLLLLFRDELPASEAAEALGIKAGALYTRKNRALGRLRAALTGGVKPRTDEAREIDLGSASLRAGARGAGRRAPR